MAVTIAEPGVQGNLGSGVGTFERGGTVFDSHALATSASDLVMYPFRNFSGGFGVYSANVTLTWYVMMPGETTPCAAYDADVAAVSQVTGAAERAVAIPPSLFGAAYIGAVASGSCNATIFLKK